MFVLRLEYRVESIYGCGCMVLSGLYCGCLFFLEWVFVWVYPLVFLFLLVCLDFFGISFIMITWIDSSFCG